MDEAEAFSQRMQAFIEQQMALPQDDDVIWLLTRMEGVSGRLTYYDAGYVRTRWVFDVVPKNFDPEWLRQLAPHASHTVTYLGLEIVWYTPGDESDQESLMERADCLLTALFYRD